MLRGTLMGLRRDRSAYVVPASVVTLLAGLLSFGLLPLVMVERGYWRWSRSEQVKLQATTRAFALFDPTASSLVRLADDFASRQERRLWVYASILLGIILASAFVVGFDPTFRLGWTSNAMHTALAGLLMTGPASAVLIVRMVAHGRAMSRVISSTGAWQMERQHRPVRAPPVWVPDPFLLACAVGAAAAGAVFLALPWLVAAMWRGWVLRVSARARLELADRLEDAAGLSHDPCHATLPAPSA
jgi:hypothetical protein